MALAVTGGASTTQIIKLELCG
ncbi:uncharacterized protein G2W53_031078 [Senna tora]|uniref:Uncharacterized protein n=1 Tax=Senna tora TaxID=362788 RepID=A0A834TGT6_9FABA|nr:uncharacterized protein G2W53_031078 [Senna tora]